MIMLPADIRSELTRIGGRLPAGAFLGGCVGQAGKAVLYAVPGGIMGSGQINASGKTWREALDNLDGAISEWVDLHASVKAEC